MKEEDLPRLSSAHQNAVSGSSGCSGPQQRFRLRIHTDFRTRVVVLQFTSGTGIQQHCHNGHSHQIAS